MDTPHVEFLQLQMRFTHTHTITYRLGLLDIVDFVDISGWGPHIQLDLFAPGVNLQTARRARPAGGGRNVALARLAVQQLHLQDAKA